MTVRAQLDRMAGHAVTDRERFLSLVANCPPASADAIVVLCGEDAKPRLDFGVGLLRDGAAPVLVLSGGRHGPPRWVGAEAAKKIAYGMGVPPDRIITETTSQNTHEQALSLVAAAKEKGWCRLLVVASEYHLPRAVLTFIRAIGSEDLHVIGIGANQARRFGCPAGMDVTRLDLLGSELEKIDRYPEHVASYAEGLAYLQRWEPAD